jgi:hypothetical protein
MPEHGVSGCPSNAFTPTPTRTKKRRAYICFETYARTGVAVTSEYVRGPVPKAPPEALRAGRIRRYGPLLEDIDESELTPAEEIPERVAEIRQAMKAAT